MDDGEVEAGFRAVVEKDGVDDFAGARRKAERYVGNSENRANVRDAFFDETNPVDCFNRAANIVFIARGARKNERIENYIFWADAVLSGEQPVGALSDFEFSLAGKRLRLIRIFVDAPDDDRGAVGAHERADAFELFFAVFEIDGIDDALALAIREREFDRGRVRGIDHERSLDFADELIVERRNVLHLVAIGALQADVNHVGATFYLTASDFCGFLPLFGGDQILERARADHVGALADNERARAFFGFDHFDTGIDGAMFLFGWPARRLAFGHLGDCANVIFGGSAAAADNVEPAAIHEALELFRERSRRFAIAAFFVGQSRIRVARDVSAGERLHGANVICHEFGTGGAVQAERKQLNMIERCPECFY